MTLLSMSELKVLRQQQAFLQNHAKTILFLLVYVLKNLTSGVHKYLLVGVNSTCLHGQSTHKDHVCVFKSILCKAVILINTHA